MDTPTFSPERIVNGRYLPLVTDYTGLCPNLYIVGGHPAALAGVVNVPGDPSGPRCDTCPDRKREWTDSNHFECAHEQAVRLHCMSNKEAATALQGQDGGVSTAA